ncbi:uncharacterized protein B0H64DRAFT_382400 [Chaetomium fimeti]|uniref:t-SNARE coiled-coil homology domain-containing protein n=1 Tax=Chaetomium fimeti TaxID=1854472 RepID=A0AAE0HR85_9PEZI|nr:hypothetical protein B0H64DRAFT_382400 [Chaetomium fimeti]
MGRFGALFKKSEKEKPESNPYAQQQQQPGAQSPAQSSPPPQYDQYTQYNNSQYNENQYASQRPQGQPSGLPAGPRPGGLAGRVAPGQSFGNDKSPPPPQYSPQPSQYSAYGGGSPSLGSAAGTPVLPSNTSSPSIGTGFEPAPSPYGDSMGPPQQHQGGYGGLGDTSGGGLFDNYKPPSKESFSPVPGQTEAPYGSQEPYVDRSQMTEEEREEADVQVVKDQINDLRRQDKAASNRILMAVEQSVAMSANNLQTAQDQGDRLAGAHKNLTKSGTSVVIAGQNAAHLERLNRSFLRPTGGKARLAQMDHTIDVAERRGEAQIQQTNQELYESRAAQEAGPPRLLGSNKPKVRSDLLFEDFDGEQEKDEEEIEGNLWQASQLLKQTAQNSVALNREVDFQNKMINQMTDQADTVHDQLRKEKRRLDHMIRK